MSEGLEVAQQMLATECSVTLKCVDGAWVAEPLNQASTPNHEMADEE